jgi:primosomal protein N' (replication factor Y)
MSNRHSAGNIVTVAVPVPLRQTFDFLRPAGQREIRPGVRIRVPFGRRELIGIVIAVKESSDYPISKLKQGIEVLDQTPLFDRSLWSTLQWLASYYLAPIGEVLDAAIPVKLRQGGDLSPAPRKIWRLTELGQSTDPEKLARAPLQQAIVKRFLQHPSLCPEDFKEDSSSWRQAIRGLLEKQWLLEGEEAPELLANKHQHPKSEPALQLNREQADAVSALNASLSKSKFSCSLLHGVTGSGKTEVYFRLMQRLIEQGKQVLFLVPEIGLTPQLIERLECSFVCPIAVLHSGLNETERHQAWWHARAGNAGIIIGTRSAVFCSCKDLGLIVVDEEHDASFKQQDGVRYQARDVAIYRAKQQKIPIILGSATPSLETYFNAQQGRYQNLKLTERATKAPLPKIELFDTNVLPCTDGLSPPMLEAISQTLKSGKQAMLFLNRRGYAPVMYCKECGETVKCRRCDSHLTLHRNANQMRCHHCGYQGAASDRCTFCQQHSLVEVGEGTQRVEEALQLRFPDARLLRIDRDSTRRKGELAEFLELARSGEADILLGTQLLTKGHDFPNVAMVGILGADQGLYSTDFRSSEVLFQQILQVSGRAGRRDTQGRVFIQTAFPQHPFFNRVRDHNFDDFALNLLAERKLAAYPPFGYFALLRAESTYQDKALQFLRRAKMQLGSSSNQNGVKTMDVIPAPMEFRAGKYRAQLLLCSDQRSSLNRVLSKWLEQLSQDVQGRKLASAVRWSLDVDPFDHY